MKFLRIVHTAGAAIALMAATASPFDQAISGAAKIKLTGTITQDQMKQCRQDAKLRLKPELVMWLEDQKGIRVDTADYLMNLLFESFLDSCISRAKETTAFKEKYWTCTYTMLPEAISTALKSFNDRIELLAVHAWARLENAIKQQNFEEIYYQSVSVIAYATAYLGPLLTVEGNSNKILIEEGRRTLKDFLNRVYLSSTNQILEGRPGRLVANPPRMSVTIDGRPFSGLGVTGYVPGGADMFTGVADNSGVVSFENLMVPFVKNGTMMYVTPNLGRVINSKWRVGVKDFGVKTREDLTQTFFFKISRPTYTLTYQAAATDPTDTIPPDIASGAMIKKYLADSCYLQPAAGGEAADLNISISFKFSSAGSSEEEQGMARFQGTVLIQAPNLTPPRNETENVEYEKKYDKILIYYDSKRGIEKISSVPVGSFLWESNVRVKAAIRRILNRL